LLDASAAERRATVWQTLGFLNAALSPDSPDALALLQARAYADDLIVYELAEQLLDQRIPIEDLAFDSDRAR